MVKIKGVNQNLVFTFEDGDFDGYYQEIQNKVINNQQLFRGSKIVFTGTGLAQLKDEELVKIQQFCLKNGMLLNNIDNLPPSLPLAKTVKETDPIPNSNLFVHKSLRSGQKVQSPGSVIVWGDVHESAEIQAAQDIIVLGKLEGIAHAGMNGDYDSIVFALQLAPSQIRIANHISRSAEEPVRKNYPEIAYLEKEGICIREYKPKDFR